jgi:hypothetical protein
MFYKVYISHVITTELTRVDSQKHTKIPSLGKKKKKGKKRKNPNKKGGRKEEEKRERNLMEHCVS